jgi:hypothetical protein
MSNKESIKEAKHGANRKNKETEQEANIRRKGAAETWLKRKV